MLGKTATNSEHCDRNNRLAEQLLEPLISSNIADKGPDAIDPGQLTNTKGNEPQLLDANGNKLLYCVNTKFEFNPYMFIRNIPALPENLSKLLPPKLKLSPKMTLILDLDETLVHCSTTPFDNPHIIFSVSLFNKTHTVYGRIRPFTNQFLTALAPYFEIGIFTASQKPYANAIRKILDPANVLISWSLSRESCVNVNGVYVKPLKRLARLKQHCVIVDNSLHAFAWDLENGIPITSWYEDRNDCELLDIMSFLMDICKEEDVRPGLRKMYAVEQDVYDRS